MRLLLSLIFVLRSLSQFQVNALGVIHSIQAFLPLLRASPTKKIAVIGTPGGISEVVREANVGNMVAYGMTKAAAHLATTKWALLLAPEGFIVVTVSPGLVNTSGTMGEGGEADRLERLRKAEEEFEKMGMPVKLMSTKEAVELQLGAIDALTKEQNGAFLEPTKV